MSEVPVTNRLQHKVALVTGAASGIGAEIASRFRSEGALVVLTDADLERGAHVAASLGPEAIFIGLDVTQDQSWTHAMALVRERFGKLDVLVNNAGITRPGNVESLSLDDWRVTLDVDLTGVFLGCRHGVKAMRATGGAIINISSAYGIKADPDTVAYNAAKSAVVLLSKSIALHCARSRYDITCNIVHPGVVRTAMMDAYLAACPDPDAEARRWTDMHPVGRLGTPAEVSAVVSFLASAEARFITGASYVVDGGLSL
jgi:NAD(P)-dependent dehydrogenase (short-subunit alcohol dehydrogenase family)